MWLKVLLLDHITAAGGGGSLLPPPLLSSLSLLRCFGSKPGSGGTWQCCDAAPQRMAQPAARMECVNLRFKTQCNFVGMNCSDKVGRTEFLNLLNGRRHRCLALIGFCAIWGRNQIVLY